MGLFDMFKKNKEEQQPEADDFKSTDEILEHLLSHILPQTLNYKTERQGNKLYLPELDTEIAVDVHMPQPNNVGLAFYVYARSIGKHFYEYCAGGGQDCRSAVGMAAGSFVFCFMDGYQRMLEKDTPTEFQTEFAGKRHEWEGYNSCTVGAGTIQNKTEDLSVAFWNLLEPEVKKRLGNQKVALVKVYAARFPTDAIGEVRIDDVEIHELSEMVREMAETWKVEQFASEKQFFFIRQKESTYIPSLYDGEEGFRKMRSAVVEYLKLFAAATTRELHDRLFDDTVEKIGDVTLANECCNILPEMATINALEGKVKVSDMITLVPKTGNNMEVYFSQLSDYEMLLRCLNDIMSNQEFGEETDKIWQNMIGYSSICNALHQAIKGGSKIEDLSMFRLMMHVYGDFELR